MTVLGLTSRQNAALAFIRRHIADNDESPSYDQIADALDVKSKSTVVRLVAALEERGYIARLPRRARSIAIVDHSAPDSGDHRMPPLHALNSFLARLPATVTAKLSEHCRRTGESAEDVIADAIAIHLDKIERYDAEEATKCL